MTDADLNSAAKALAAIQRYDLTGDSDQNRVALEPTNCDIFKLEQQLTSLRAQLAKGGGE